MASRISAAVGMLMGNHRLRAPVVDSCYGCGHNSIRLLTILCPFPPVHTKLLVSE